MIKTHAWKLQGDQYSFNAKMTKHLVKAAQDRIGSERETGREDSE